MVFDLEYQHVPVKNGRAGTDSYSDVQPIPACLPGAELAEMTAVSFTLTLLVPVGGVTMDGADSRCTGDYSHAGEDAEQDGIRNLAWDKETN